MNLQLDVIVPFYNEAENLQALVKRISQALKKDKISYRIIAVDDHSTDKSVSILKRLSKTHPITILTKKGQRGKAFSIIEGAKESTAPYIAMIDADLQYPPEVLPDMYRLTQQYGAVVARRQDFQAPKIRQFMSRGFQWFFGKLLYGLDCDIQSGLKVFKRDIIESVHEKDVTAWTLDIPLLTTALDLGYGIGQVAITFAKRTNGESKINLITSIREIGGQAISYRMRRKDPFRISPHDENTMVGAGLIHRGKKFITHTTLETKYSALHVITAAQKFTILAMLAALLIGLLLTPFTALKVFVAILSTIYFVDVIFNLFVLLKSLNNPPEIQIPKSETDALKDKDLPVYTIMCPLYKEAHVLPQFVENISKIDWPKSKLEVMLLLEADDVDTIAAAEAMNLPKYVTVQVVPDSQPKTKPKACNYGLHFAKGEFLVIYDAEDDPDPLQLKKVYIAFQKAAANVKCIQAKLNFYNPHQNLLTRFFTAEYSLWFDVVLTGLQSINTTIPLGGTSNHFRTADLRDLQGWDPFNVTEDCDLGIRLFKRGALTAVIDSVTLEEANSNWGNWLRQRSRWIKGYMQTYLVHMRNPVRFAKEYGWHSLMFQLVVGGKIAFMLINPFMWLLTITYFALNAWAGPTIEALYPSVVFYMAITSLLFGNFMFIYYYMIGAAKREHWSVIKWVFLVPIYWLLVSVAACIALYELVVKPHYWQKTVHGLHLKKKEVEKQAKEVTKDVVAHIIAETTEASLGEKQSVGRVFSLTKMNNFFRVRKQISIHRSISVLFRKITQGLYLKGTILVIATVMANFLNMATSFYLGHELSLSDFAVYNTYLSLQSICAIFYATLSTTVNHQAARLLGKYSGKTIRNFWVRQRNRMFLVSWIAAALWVICLPFISSFFSDLPILPFVLFIPILLFGAVGAVNQGYLRGSLSFHFVAIATIMQPVVRLVLSIFFGETDQESLAYISIPVAFVASVVASTYFAGKGEDVKIPHKELRLPRNFFVLALLSNISSIAFFSVDNLIVAHYLSSEEVGLYGILGLLGKMIFFTGTLITGFILPITAYQEGRGQSSQSVFRQLVLLATGLTGLAFVGIGIGVPLVSPWMFGEKINSVRLLLPLFSLGIFFYTISQAIVQFHLAKKHYIFTLAAFGLAAFQVLGLALYHRSLTEIVWVMCISGVMNLLVLGLLHFFYKKILPPLANLRDLSDLLFSKFSSPKTLLETKTSYRILIMNWRDIKHVWAGGAEVYLHELAQELVKKGHQVTIFCGNDGRSQRTEMINGVQIIRRGGFFTVYIWAFLYYIFKLRHHFDFVIDSENGIPFFTPLYVRKPIYLLIHHVHQDVFRKHLIFPFSEIASVVEGELMPELYKHHTVLTVSKSSRDDILELGLGSKKSIEIIHPGIPTKLFKPAAKTKKPSLVYVGRLKPYKNLDTSLHAFAAVLQQIPDATYTIAGKGESKSHLVRLVRELNIEKSVIFVEDISNQEKAKLFARSWVAIQPSVIEGWGITVIEANASGTPVVASNVRGLRDSVQNKKTGILVHPKKADHFAAAIISLFTNNELRLHYSENAKQWADAFSWDKSVEQFLQIVSTQATSTNTSNSLATSET